MPTQNYILGQLKEAQALLPKEPSRPASAFFQTTPQLNNKTTINDNIQNSPILSKLERPTTTGKKD
jgi:hypothetical protein